MSKPLVVLTMLLPLAAILLYAGAAQGCAAGGNGVFARGRMQSVPRVGAAEQVGAVGVHHRAPCATPMGGARGSIGPTGSGGLTSWGTTSSSATVRTPPTGRWRWARGGRRRSTRAHCRSPEDYYNEHGIGICLVGNFDETRPTAAQVQSLTRLVKYLRRTYDIPADKVFSHGGVTGMTHCPGKHFDLKALRKAVR